MITKPEDITTTITTDDRGIQLNAIVCYCNDLCKNPVKSLDKVTHPKL